MSTEPERTSKLPESPPKNNSNKWSASALSVFERVLEFIKNIFQSLIEFARGLPGVYSYFAFAILAAILVFIILSLIVGLSTISLATSLLLFLSEVLVILLIFAAMYFTSPRTRKQTNNITISTNKDEHLTLEQQFKQAVQQSNWEEVIRTGLEILRQGSNDLNIRHEVSRAYIQRGGGYGDFKKRASKAIQEDYKPALELDSNNFEAWVCCAKAHHQLDELDEAVYEYDFAIQIATRQLQASNNLGIKKEDRIWTFGSRGWVYFDLQQYSQAIEDFTRVLNDHGDAWVYMKRGDAYRANGNLDQACKDYTMAIELSSGSGAYYDNLAKTYLLLKRPVDAFSYYKLGWSKDERVINNGWMAEWCQLCLSQRVDRGEVAKKLEGIAAKNPSNSMSTLCLGVGV